MNEYDKRNKLSDNFVIVKPIGSGSFGDVYLAQHKSGGYVAAKIENKQKIARVFNEFKIYTYLRKSGFRTGLPKTYSFIETPDSNIMIMQLLGPNLDDLFIKYNRCFDLATIFKLTDQLLQLIKSLHNAHFIHRDIKPNNFLIGRGNNTDQIYMMDFGLSRKYINDGQHISFRDNRSLIGTARYASINMHLGIEPTRRDDLESIGYMLIYFIKGRLPWQGLKKKQGYSNIELIGESKMCTSLDLLCENIPNCFKEYLQYCRNLKFNEDPDYEYLRELFNTTKNELNIMDKYVWCNQF